MKIAITGHTHGIGKAFAEQLSKRGHEIIGISRRDGENIRRVVHTATLIEPADLFINNAQSNYAQTELLYEVWKRWANWMPPREKWIWNISTMLTQDPEDYKAGGLNAESLGQYRTQKVALEEAVRALIFTQLPPPASTALTKPDGLPTFCAMIPLILLIHVKKLNPNLYPLKQI